MTDELGEVLSRVFDGETVDEAKLEEALAQPDAAALLLEFAGLRRMLRADLGLPSTAFCDRMRQRLRVPAWKRLLQERFMPAAVAASLTVAAAAAGYGVRWWRERPGPASSPVVLTGPPVAPVPQTTKKVGPPPPAVRPQPASVRPRIPQPRLREPFAQWRDGA